MKFQHYSTKYSYIEEDDKIGAGFMDKVKPLLKIAGKHLLKGDATLAGNKLGYVIVDKLTSSNTKILQPDTALAIAQNARRKIFEDLNIIPKKQETSLPSVKLAAKIANPGLANPPMSLPVPKVNPMMIGNGMSKSKKEKILSSMKFFEKFNSASKRGLCASLRLPAKRTGSNKFFSKNLIYIMADYNEIRSLFSNDKEYSNYSKKMV